MKLLMTSDLHGNWPALLAVAQNEENVDGVACLGDIVNYGPNPAQCVEWVQSNVKVGWAVQGNHDRAVGCDEDPKCSGPYRKLAAEMQRYTRKQVRQAGRAFLARLPTSTTPVLKGGAIFFFCHAAPTDPLYAYVEQGDTKRWSRECEFAGYPDFLFCGHTHLPFICKIGRTTVVNPGSVGQPKGGDPCAHYAVWRDGEVTLRSVAYDIEKVVKDLDGCASAKTTAALASILRNGGNFPDASDTP